MYVLQVMSNEEKSVLRHLARKNLLGYVPREMRRERRGGKEHLREKILMPGYVFLDKDSLSPETYYAAKNIPQVICFLGGSKNPAKLTEAEEEHILLLANAGLPLQAGKVLLKEDGGVKILEGALRGYEGKVLSVNRRDRRIIMSVDFAGEQRRISLTAEILEERKDEHKIQTGAGVDSLLLSRKEVRI
ncbi:MAG: transcription termination/antitermination NusG family protein [Peptostreptococcaceae bacterium]|nr:transcription termination/antitermination NusG family protein [Peptostreptococcaceae bacterium]